MIAMFEGVSEILSYGLTGLAAIITILAYRLLAHQNKKDDPNPSMLTTIRFFMILGIILAVLSGISGVVESTTNSKVKALEMQLQLSEVTAKERRDTLARMVASKLGSVYRRAEGKSRAIDYQEEIAAVHEKLLRQAVFFHLLSFNADAEVLEKALRILVSRGHRDAEHHISTIVKDLPKLTAIKLRWLEDDALPALQRDIEHLKARPMVQRSPAASVILPRELWLMNHEKGDEPTTTVMDINELKKEVALLKMKL